jgi:hypothetical protein
MATPETGEAIARIIPQGEKQQHFILATRMGLRLGYYDPESVQK